MSFPVHSLRAAFAVATILLVGAACSDSRDASLISGPRTMAQLEEK
jgi:hypothetical protein